MTLLTKQLFAVRTGMVHWYLLCYSIITCCEPKLVLSTSMGLQDVNIKVNRG